MKFESANFHTDARRIIHERANIMADARRIILERANIIADARHIIFELENLITDSLNFVRIPLEAQRKSGKEYCQEVVFIEPFYSVKIC